MAKKPQWQVVCEILKVTEKELNSLSQRDWELFIENLNNGKHNPEPYSIRELIDYACRRIARRTNTMGGCTSYNVY